MNSDFQLIEDPREADAMLLLAAGELASTMVWRKTEGSSFFALFAGLSRPAGKVEINIIDPSETENLRMKLKADSASEFFFSINSSKAILFFKAVFLSTAEGSSTFCFSAPELVYRVQRRAHLRYQFQLEDRIVVRVADPKRPSVHVTRAMGDLSAGGFSLFLKEEEATHFSAGVECKGIEFSIGAQKISKVNAVIRHRRSSADPELGIGQRVGFEFQDLPSDVNQIIQKFVVGQIQKYFQGAVSK